ncbi:hypothetical protein ONZ45_g17874 [Pleurotus djamor]|nr:hypothetical protein ONZ45_g17874 [Pleurotus djamor]
MSIPPPPAGLDLGHIGGQLSIIILRPVTEGATTHIIDVMALDSQALQPIFNLIQADSPIKVVYDGRMDYTELNATFNVKMGKTLDMQIVDVLSRRTRGQPLRKQIRRFPQWLRKYAFQSPSFYTDIHNLSSLGYAMREHEIQDVGKSKVDHGKWLDRPLSQEYLNYAANDVRLIELLYHKLSEESFIYDVDELAITSQRYLGVWNGERTALDDKFTQHSLLPLNIVDYDDSADRKYCSK